MSLCWPKTVNLSWIGNEKNEKNWFGVLLSSIKFHTLPVTICKFRHREWILREKILNNLLYHFPPILKESSQKYPFFACFLAFHNTLIISHYVHSLGIASFFLQPHEWIIIYTNYIFYNCCKLLSVHECNAYLYVCKHYDFHFFSSVFILGYVTVQ